MTKHDKTRSDRIVDFVADFSATMGYPPSVREIMTAVGLHSTGSCQYLINRLIEEGRLRRIHGIQRGLLIVP